MMSLNANFICNSSVDLRTVKSEVASTNFLQDLVKMPLLVLRVVLCAQTSVSSRLSI